MLRGLLLGVAITAGGCYRIPEHEACTIRCDHANNPTCPAGLTCGADNLCSAGTQCDQRRDAAVGEAGDIDAPILVDGSICYGNHLVTYCPSTPLPNYYFVPTGMAPMIDTDAGEPGCTVIQAVGGVEVCVIAANVIDIQGGIIATGQRPLVLFGLMQIAITGRIDVSAGGAGASSMVCASANGEQQLAPGGSAGGGAGGSFTRTGGEGGAVYTTLARAQPGAETSAIPVIRGGCAGGAGGAGFPNSATEGGTAGKPGGAAYLLSPSDITISGTINASGGGGGGGKGVINASVGGGGGGSGGFIGIEGNTLTLAATTILIAQGGGGGAGATNSEQAAPGRPPSVMPLIPGAGGAATGFNGWGGAGADGYAPGSPGGDAAGTSASGGGGGGGPGAIRTYVAPIPPQTTGATISPPPT